MNWLRDATDFFGAIFFTNCIPHLISGLMADHFSRRSPIPKVRGFHL